MLLIMLTLELVKKNKLRAKIKATESKTNFFKSDPTPPDNVFKDWSRKPFDEKSDSRFSKELLRAFQIDFPQTHFYLK